MTNELGRMTSHVVDALDRSRTVLVIPIGATEEHGAHLPVDTDTRAAVAVARALAAQTSDVVVAPEIPYSMSDTLAPWPGYVSLTDSTFLALLTDVCQSLGSQGFRKLLLLNGHGGNRGALDLIVRRCSNEFGLRIAAVTYFDLAREAFQRDRKTPTGGTGHACEFETSLMLHLAPELVTMDAADGRPVEPLTDYGTTFMGGDFYRGSTVSLGFSFQEAFPNGVMGDPTPARAELGATSMKAVVDALKRFVDEYSALEYDPRPSFPGRSRQLQ